MSQIKENNQSNLKLSKQLSLVDNSATFESSSDFIQEVVLLEVFKECNSHIRETDKKSITITCSFIALCSILWGGFLRNVNDVSALNGSWQILFFLTFLLGIGTVVFFMQLWYREWKMHYIGVCCSIREKIMATSISEENEKFFPYWMRKQLPTSRFSIDNLFMYSIFIINFLIFIAIFLELQILQPI